MPKYHILRNYSELPDGQLGEFALHVATALTGNANFTTPPVTPAALTTAANNFITALAAAVDGNPTAIANKNALRTTLIGLLDQEADYVELTSLNNQTKLLSSGFHLASTTRSPAVPGKTCLLAVANVATTKLGLKLAVADNAWAYVVETSVNGGPWTMAEIFTDPHDAVLTGLTPGVTYAIRVQVHGSGNQRSEYCDPVMHMCT